MTTTRAVIYARVSTKDGRQDTDNQLRQLREFARAMKWKIVGEHIDHASGKRGDRDQFLKMFAAASRRDFDVVLFWSLDRFSREGVLKTLTYLQRLTDYGVSYRSFTEQYLDSTGIFREAIIGILAAIAKQEHIRISERTLAGLAKARAQGRIGGRPPIDEKRVTKVRALRGQGHSIRAIAATMKLSPGTVQKIVSQPS